MPEKREKVEVIRFNENQMIRMAGVAERGVHAADRLRKSIQMVFNTDGLVARVAAERHLSDMAEQLDTMATELRKVHGEIVKDGELVTDDVLRDVENMFGEGGLPQ